MDYEAILVNLSEGEQFKPNFLKISPNGRIPAIVDTENDLSIFESGAILFYLAEKHNKFLGEKTTDKIDVIQWLMFQMGNLGPLLGQAHHFNISAPTRIHYAMTRYSKEATRLYGVLDKRLFAHPFVAG